jgi:hypothetical protein
LFVGEFGVHDTGVVGGFGIHDTGVVGCCGVQIVGGVTGLGVHTAGAGVVVLGLHAMIFSPFKFLFLEAVQLLILIIQKYFHKENGLYHRFFSGYNITLFTFDDYCRNLPLKPY